MTRDETEATNKKPDRRETGNGPGIVFGAELISPLWCV
jgi:hypothetical protein